MAIDEKTIYVYDDFSYNAPVLLGMLYVGVVKGVATYSFEFDKECTVSSGKKRWLI